MKNGGAGIAKRARECKTCAKQISGQSVPDLPEMQPGLAWMVEVARADRPEAGGSTNMIE